MDGRGRALSGTSAEMAEVLETQEQFPVNRPQTRRPLAPVGGLCPPYLYWPLALVFVKLMLACAYTHVTPRALYDREIALR